MIAVDLHLVRYSPVEGTHWFYDPSYPTTIQFLLNGRWEPWDVGWVRQRAQDPEVKRIAEVAEARLVHDSTSGYIAWPPTSPHRPNSSPDSQASPQCAPPPSLANGEGSLARSRPPSLGYAPSPIFPTFEFHDHRPLKRESYTSPYAPQPSPPPPGIGIGIGHHTSARLHQRNHSSGTTNSNQVSPLSPVDPNLPDNPTLSIPPTSLNAHHPNPPAPLLPTVPNRETKILLSLDGDGVRGLSAVLLVESLVNAICSRMNRRVDPYQIFDLIGGVSNGGLLAILIGRLQMRAHRAREAYLGLAKDMFTDKLRFFTSLDRLVEPPQHDEHMLERSVKNLVAKECQNPDELLFDPRTESTHVFVITIKVEIGSNQAAIIRSYPTRRMAGPELDTDLTLWQAIHATIAAPRYLDTQGGNRRRAVIKPGLVDYGTAKNNPVRDLFYECRKLYSYANDTMIVVSIGTGTGCDKAHEAPEMLHSVRDRKLEAKFAGDKFEVDMRELRERGWMKYFRFNVPMDDVPLDESEQLDLVMAKTHAYLAEPQVSREFYACVEAIVGILMAEQIPSSRAA